MKAFQISIFFFLFSSAGNCSNGADSTKNVAIKNLEKVLKNAIYEKGTIYLNNDSIIADIIIYKKQFRKNSYLYCITRREDGSVKIFTADEIQGYRIQDDYYFRHVANSIHFFIHRVREGELILYEKPPTFFDNRFLYYIKFPENNFLYVVCPFEGMIETFETPTNPQYNASGGNQVFISSNEISEQFKSFITQYFSSCTKVVNMVNSNFYTINDVLSIVDTYNNCKNEK